MLTPFFQITICNSPQCLWRIYIQTVRISTSLWKVSTSGLWGILDGLQKRKRSKVWRKLGMFVLSMREFTAAPVTHEWIQWMNGVWRCLLRCHIPQWSGLLGILIMTLWLIIPYRKMISLALLTPHESQSDKYDISSFRIDYLKLNFMCTLCVCFLVLISMTYCLLMHIHALRPVTQFFCLDHCKYFSLPACVQTKQKNNFFVIQPCYYCSSSLVTKLCPHHWILLGFSWWNTAP